MAQYYDGKTAQSFSATLTLQNETYFWATQAASGAWPISECSLEAGSEGVTTICRGDERIVVEASEWQCLGHLSGKSERTLFQNLMIYGGGVLLVLALAVVLLSRSGELLARWITLEKEQQWLAVLDPKAGNEAESQILSELIGILKPQRPIEISLLPEDEPNAFALPGVRISVTRGMVCFVSGPDELMAILAHEVEHIEQRHILKGLVNQLGLGLLWTLVTGDLGGSYGVLFAQWAVSNHYSQADESEADRGAVERLTLLGLDPGAGAKFFERLQNKKGQKVLEFLVRTHPPSQDRADFYKSHALPKDIQAVSTIESERWQALLQRLGCESRAVDL
jgi:Zn-dependent protease with chaperone function